MNRVGALVLPHNRKHREHSVTLRGQPLLVATYVVAASADVREQRRNELRTNERLVWRASVQRVAEFGECRAEEAARVLFRCQHREGEGGRAREAAFGGGECRYG